MFKSEVDLNGHTDDGCDNQGWFEDVAFGVDEDGLGEVIGLLFDFAHEQIG